MVWEKTSNFCASFPDPINTYGFCLVSSEKAHWHAQGLLWGLNLSRCVSVCGTRAFLYLLTDRFIALQGVLHKSTCLRWLFFFLERPLLGLALVTAPQIYTVGRPGSNATKGGLWAGLYGQPWSDGGLVGCSGWFLVLSKCVLHVLRDSRRSLREMHSCLC